MSGFDRVCARTLCALALGGVPWANAADPSRLPLHWLWHERDHDSAYTVSAERRERLVRERGYADMGIVAWVDARPGPNARALVCFYSGAPRTDTFCSISALEQRVVRAMGYETIGDEGFIAIERAPGAVVLYRVSRAHGDGADREHRFTISGDELVRLRKDGWTYDGSKGYVYSAP